jgi:hypothetical protein
METWNPVRTHLANLESIFRPDSGVFCCVFAVMGPKIG